MAVVAPLPLQSNETPWTSNDSVLYSTEARDSMPQVMSGYHYPPPPGGHDRAEMDSSGYHTAHHYHQQQDPSVVEDRHRRELYSTSAKLKHSKSTPHVRPLEEHEIPPLPNGMPDHSAMSAAEKRRNKLGYHRTSVACGHCRRRKIRCIPSPADVQGRCINCIRLKKECSFYPVDQQPLPDPKHRSISRSSTGHTLTSASTSPVMENGVPVEIHGQHGYPIAVPSMQAMAPPMKPHGEEGPDASYGQAGNWVPADANASVGRSNEAGWRYPTEASVASSAAGYAPYPDQAPTTTWSRDDVAWTGYQGPPTRTVSFGSDTMASHHEHYPDRPYGAPPIATTIPGIETVPGTTMDHEATLSAGAVTSAGYQTWGQYQYAKPGDGYAQWYEGQHGEQAPHSSEHHSGSTMYYADR